MTYKRFMEMMVEKESCKWMQELCGEEWMVLDSEVELFKDKGHILYNVTVTMGYLKIYGIERTFIVGGAIANLDGGICNSVVRRPLCDGNEEVVWAANEELRELYGIEEFRILAPRS